MQVNYQSYIDAEKIPEKYLRQIFNLQSFVWGQEPFGEYKICDNHECRKVFSIEDVHEGLDCTHEGKGNSFCCSDCNSSTSYMYKTEEFYELMKEYIRGNVSMILMISPGELVEGFGVISQGTVASISHFEFQTRPGGLSSEKIISALSQNIFGIDDASEEELVCFHQIYVSKNVRDAAVTFKLMQELFFQTGEIYSHLPVVGETRYDGKFYPVSRSIGFNDVIQDKYGYVIQSIDRYSDILKFLWENDGFSEFQGTLLRYRKHARDIVNKGNFKGEKYYKE